MSFGNDFLEIVPKAKQQNKNKNKTNKQKNKWDLIKLRIFYTENETINKVKIQPKEWEKITCKHISDKGLISTIYKKLTQLSNKTNPIKNGQKT